jgi:hypothetical protein
MKILITLITILITVSGCLSNTKNNIPAANTTTVAPSQTVGQPANKPSDPKVHQANIAFLDAKLSQAGKLTAAEKEDLIKFLEDQYKTPVLLSEPRYNGKVVYFIQVANNPDLTVEQKKSAIKARFKQDSKAMGF